MVEILKEVRVLKKVHRSPEKFDALSVFATWAQRHAVPLRQEDAVPRFAEFLQHALKESLASDTMLFGGRTQAMFDAVVANLGAVRLVKSEDCGDIYSADDTIQVPDTRIVLADGRNLLVEVKNNAADWLKPFRRKTTYFDGLQRYADLTRSEFRLAIYWQQTGVWTLVRLDAMKDEGRFRSIRFTDAFTHNDMGALGDVLVGCRPPLVLQMHVAKEEGGGIRFVHPLSRVFTGGREVFGDVAKHLFRFMLFYGSWRRSKPKIIDESKDYRIVEAQAAPEEPEDEAQGTPEGSRLDSLLSSMLSRRWLQGTITWDGELAGLSPRLGAWDHQLVNVTTVEPDYFSIGRITSSLDQDRYASPRDG
jgi:hypothetical protein